jgi:hypothetical protein
MKRNKFNIPILNNTYNLYKYHDVIFHYEIIRYLIIKTRYHNTNKFGIRLIISKK